MNSLLGNKPVVAFLQIFVILYGSLVAPKLPASALWIFDTFLFRVLVMFVIAMLATREPALSLLVAVAFIMTLNYLNGKKLLEAFRVEQNTNVHPGCLGLKIEDLKKVFNGNHDELVRAARNAAVPFNIPFDDEFAPVIATYLTNIGYDIAAATEKSSCKLNDSPAVW